MLNQYQLIDLSHCIDETMPVWPGDRPFSKQLRSDYPQGAKIYDYQFSEGIGTHIDAPAHTIKGGATIDQLALSQLVAPACLLDVSEQAATNPDYAISAADILAWEAQHQQIMPGNIVLAYTGWSKHWDMPSDYLNIDSDMQLHFPGFSADAAKLLVSRRINGVGIDTLSLDPGNQSDFPAHHIFLNANVFQIENLAQLSQLPATGAFVFALPIKVSQGPEAPARVIALVPEPQDQQG